MAKLSPESLPVHVGIIMDGNGRWARRRGLSRSFGHKKGADVFGKIARHAAKTGIRHLTVYAFSTENWKRPPEEIRAIMDLLRDYLGNLEQYKAENIRTRILGEKSALDADIQDKIAYLEENSRKNTGMQLNIALNYGGRDEILHAVRTLVQVGISHPEQIDEAMFARFLYTAGQPDVDLVIRTSGEQRVSNFLLWQGAYAEYVFSKVLWPDFSPRHFDKALREYAARTRRMGGV